MFIASIYVIIKNWKWPKCLSVDAWIKKVWYLPTVEYHSAVIREQAMTHLTTFMGLRGIILSEENQYKRLDTIWFNWYNILKMTKVYRAEQ